MVEPVLLVGVVATGLVLLIAWFWPVVSARWKSRGMKADLARLAQSSAFERPSGPVSVRWDEKEFFAAREQPYERLGSMRWSDVTRAVASRDGEGRTGRVGIYFQSETGPEGYVHEGMSHWSEFCQILPERLPGARAVEDWSAALRASPSPGEGVDVFVRA